MEVDHEALLYLKHAVENEHNARLLRIFTSVQRYDFKLVYKPGCKHLMPDAISRLFTFDDRVEYELRDPESAFGPVKINTLDDIMNQISLLQGSTQRIEEADEASRERRLAYWEAKRKQLIRDTKLRYQDFIDPHKIDIDPWQVEMVSTEGIPEQSITSHYERTQGNIKEVYMTGEELNVCQGGDPTAITCCGAAITVRQKEGKRAVYTEVIQPCYEMHTNLLTGTTAITEIHQNMNIIPSRVEFKHPRSQYEGDTDSEEEVEDVQMEQKWKEYKDFMRATQQEGTPNPVENQGNYEVDMGSVYKVKEGPGCWAITNLHMNTTTNAYGTRSKGRIQVVDSNEVVATGRENVPPERMDKEERVLRRRLIQQGQGVKTDQESVNKQQGQWVEDAIRHALLQQGEAAEKRITKELHDINIPTAQVLRTMELDLRRLDTTKIQRRLDLTMEKERVKRVKRIERLKQQTERLELERLAKQQRQRESGQRQEVLLNQRADSREMIQLDRRRFLGPKPVLERRVAVERSETEKEEGRQRAEAQQDIIGRSFRHPETGIIYEVITVQYHENSGMVVARRSPIEGQESNEGDALLYTVEGEKGVAKLVEQYDRYAGLKEQGAEWPADEAQMLQLQREDAQWGKYIEELEEQPDKQIMVRGRYKIIW